MNAERQGEIFLRFGLAPTTDLELWHTTELSRGDAELTFNDYVEYLTALEEALQDEFPQPQPQPQRRPQTDTKSKRKKTAEDISSSGDTDAEVTDDKNKKAQELQRLQRRRSNSGRDPVKKLTQTPDSGTKTNVEESAQPVRVQAEGKEDVKTKHMASLHPALPANYVFAIACAFGGSYPSQALATEDVRAVPKRSVMSTIIDGAVQKLQRYHLKRYGSMTVEKLPELIL